MYNESTPLLLIAQIENKRLKNAKEPGHIRPGFLLRVDYFEGGESTSPTRSDLNPYQTILDYCGLLL